MDDGRKVDLANLRKQMDDITLPAKERRRAYLVFTRIRKQLTDKTLVKLRVRMIRAKRAADMEEAEKLAEQIHQHVWRTYGYWI